MAAEPIAREEILADDHSASYHHGIGNTQFVIATQTVAAEDKAADDGLQQIVGETHATKDTKVMEYAANALKGIPR